VRIGNLAKTAMGEECSGSSWSACLEHSIPGDKGQIVWPRFLKTGQARDGGVRRTDKLTPGYLVDLCQ
jgi:hypothetical protein